MANIFTGVIGLPVLASCVMAAASYPPIPADLTTPVQQRIAINGPNGEFPAPINLKNLPEFVNVILTNLILLLL